jgi:hypothetical protein
VTISRPTAVNRRSLIYREFELPLDHCRLTDRKALAEFRRSRQKPRIGRLLEAPREHYKELAAVKLKLQKKKMVVFDLVRKEFVIANRCFDRKYFTQYPYGNAPSAAPRPQSL